MAEKIDIKVKGMHCASCEVLIERRLKKVPGVEKVAVNHSTGKAELTVSQRPSIKKLNDAVQRDGYSVSLDRRDDSPAPRNGPKDYFQIGAIFLVLIGLYLLLRQFSLLPDIGVTENMGYGLVFVIGLIAATSTCLAVSGGLLLAVAAKYAEAHPDLSGAKKFKPHIYFNIGRIVSYTLLGALLGAVGSLFVFSPTVSGAITLAAAVFMILMGLQMLHLFPQGLKLKMPKFLAHRFYDQSNKEYRAGAPFFLGASTFFLPCGFTQALQLYVLATGDWVTGALTMLVFSLGTAPSLLGLGAITSFTKGSFHKHLLRVAAVLVILLGIFSASTGMALIEMAGGSAEVYVQGPLPKADPNVQMIDGKQVVSMKIVGFDYYPSQITVVKGVPVVWVVDGAKAAGCGRVLVSPKAGVRSVIDGTQTFSFTPTQSGTIPFNCAMGMMTPGSQFNVVDAVDTCDPTITNCVA